MTLAPDKGPDDLKSANEKYGVSERGVDPDVGLTAFQKSVVASLLGPQAAKPGEDVGLALYAHSMPFTVCTECTLTVCNRVCKVRRR
jgi:hypothetical protein